jgi:hypothetical protein
VISALGELTQSVLIFLFVLVLTVQVLLAYIANLVYLVIVESVKVGYVYVLKGYKHVMNKRKKPNETAPVEVKVES